MNKNLPNVYVVPIKKKINNNEELYRNTSTPTKKESINPTEINKIFNSKNHVYKTKVVLSLKDKEINTEIIGLTNDAILTLDGNKVPLNDILNIKKV